MPKRELDQPYAFRPNASHHTRAERIASPPVTKLAHSLMISDTLAEARQLATLCNRDTWALEQAVQLFADKMARAYPAFDPVRFVEQYQDDIGAALAVRDEQNAHKRI